MTNDVAQTVRPDLIFNYTLPIVRKAYELWEASGFRHRPKSLDEVLMGDDALDADLATYALWVKFHEDYSKRPSEMR